MHHFVHRITRGVIFCSVTVAVTACAGLSDLADDRQATQYPVVKKIQSEDDLSRIDAIRLRVARNAMANKDFNTAIRFFESVRDSAPGHPAPLIGIAEANMAAGSHKEAVLAFRDVLETYPDHEAALDGIGRALIATGHYREAIDYFERSLANAPSAALHNRLGVAHDLMGDGEKAQNNYRAALALDPKAISPRNNLALSLAISEFYFEAVKHMEQVAAHPDATIKHQQNLAFVYGMAGQNDAAVAALTKFGFSAPDIDKNRTLFKKARALAKSGDRAEILAYLRNGEEIGDPAMMDKLAEPAAPSTAVASAMADRQSAPRAAKPAMSSPEPMKAVLPPKALENNKVVPVEPEPKRTATLSEPVETPSKKPEPAEMASVEPAQDAIYRIQLASYRTATGAERGKKILKTLLRDDAPELEILVRQTRSSNALAFDYRIRTNPVSNRDEARTICTRIQAAGHPGCLIIQHNPRVWASVNVPEPSPDSAEQPYRVQLASFQTERGAIKGRSILAKLLGDRADDLNILVRRSRSGEATAFDYRIRTGPIKTRDEGARLCEALKEAGHQGCFVIQHNGLLWENLADAAERKKASLDRFQDAVRDMARTIVATVPVTRIVNI